MKLQEIIGNYKKKNSSIDMFVVDLEDEPDDWRKARDFLNQPSMFVDVKLALIKESGLEEKEWVKALKAYVDNQKIFIVISDRDKPKKQFGFLTKEPVVFQEFKELEGEGIKTFLQKEAANLSLKFETAALHFLCLYISSSVSRSILAHNELEKISLAKLSQPIGLASLRSIIKWNKKEAPFYMSRDIVASTDFRKKLSALEKLFLQKEAPAYIFNLLASQTRGASALKFADYDISIKSGGLDYEEALTEFVLSV